MSVDTAASPTRHPAHRGVTLWVLAGLFALGLASFVYALRSGTTRPDLRLLTVSFLYLMGVSQAGIVFCAMTRLMRARWARPYYRLAELALQRDLDLLQIRPDGLWAELDPATLKPTLP